jgi:hypothetical protein
LLDFGTYIRECADRAAFNLLGTASLLALSAMSAGRS